jgi:hypothetical protein
MRRTGQDKALARKMLDAVRDRLELVTEVDPTETTSLKTIRETLAFVRLMYRQSRLSK